MLQCTCGRCISHHRHNHLSDRIALFLYDRRRPASQYRRYLHFQATCVENWLPQCSCCKIRQQERMKLRTLMPTMRKSLTRTTVSQKFHLVLISLKPNHADPGGFPKHGKKLILSKTKPTLSREKVQRGSTQISELGAIKSLRNDGRLYYGCKLVMRWFLLQSFVSTLLPGGGR